MVFWIAYWDCRSKFITYVSSELFWWEKKYQMSISKTSVKWEWKRIGVFHPPPPTCRQEFWKFSRETFIGLVGQNLLSAPLIFPLPHAYVKTWDRGMPTLLRKLLRKLSLNRGSQLFVWAGLISFKIVHVQLVLRAVRDYVMTYLSCIVFYSIKS